MFIWAIVNMWRDDLSDSVVTSALITIFIQVLILIYLMSSGVKSWFGKT